MLKQSIVYSNFCTFHCFLPTSSLFDSLFFFFLSFLLVKKTKSRKPYFFLFPLFLFSFFLCFPFFTNFSLQKTIKIFDNKRVFRYFLLTPHFLPSSIPEIRKKNKNFKIFMTPCNDSENLRFSDDFTGRRG